MDTERSFPADESLRNFEFEPLEGEELETVQLYVEMCRHLLELQTLFRMFQFNLDSMLSTYEFMRSGDVLRMSDGTPAQEEADYVAINALVTNLISSGKTLTESMGAYINEHYAFTDLVVKDYAQYCSNIYDTVFSYRFLIRLRDYAQHGHTPVNQEGRWYGFDVRQVLEKPHYHHNPKMREAFERIINEVTEKCNDMPRFSLTICLVEYTAALLDIYAHFWELIVPLLEENHKKFQKIVQDNPQNIYAPNDFLRGFIYGYDETYEGMVHAVALDDNSIDSLKAFADEAREASDKYTKERDELKEGMKIFPI